MARNLVIVLACCLAAAGCSAKRGMEVPPVDYAELATAGPKPAVDYEAQVGGAVEGAVLPLPRFEERVEHVLAASGMFSRVRAAKGAEEFHLSLALAPKPLPEGQVIYGIVSGVTACLVPFWSRETFVLTVDVQKGGKTLKRYEYQEHVEVFAWTPVGIITELANTQATDDVADALLLAFLKDLKRDRLLEPPPGK
ncbi:MAG: hypothetical protein NTX87_02820 [Planctomycetota bacterium]|nr:hypothetical protein [Planctomycetota bacterium]